MKKICTLTLITILLFILDNTISPLIGISGYYPSLLFVFIICYAINADSLEALIVGAIVGCLIDVFNGTIFGLNGMVTMLASLGAAIIGEKIFREKMVFPVLIVCGSSILTKTIVFLVMYSQGIMLNPYNIVFSALYNMIVAILAYNLVYKLSQVEFMVKDWEFRS